MAQDAFEDIAETFEFLDDWEDRYRHVIDMGRAMDPLDEAFRVPATKVDGCASQVWLVPSVEGDGPDARLHFQGDSDAMIVRGLIALLLRVYSDRLASEILATPPDFFDAIELGSHLSGNRANGLAAMVNHIQAYARSYNDTNGATETETA